MGTVGRSMRDPINPLEAIEGFVRESAAGRVRKRLFDRAQLRRRHGVRKSWVRDENQELMHLARFMRDVEMERRRNEAWARADG